MRHLLASPMAAALAALLLGSLLAVTGFAAEPAPAPRRFIAFVGTFTNPTNKGIHAFRFDATTGEVTPLGCVAETPNPAFLALAPDGRHLYAANEIGDFRGGRVGAVSAFAVDRAAGRLTLLNQASSGGPGPCHLTVDRTGRHVLVANYTGGSVAVLPLHPDGSLGEPTTVIQHTGSSVNPQRQREPHAHSVNLSPDNRFAFVADLGADRVFVYRFDAASGSLTPVAADTVALPPGSGPRHFAFHPDGRHAFVINELLSTIAVFDYDAQTGRLAARATASTLPADFTKPSTTAEIAVHPNGRFVYGSNRGHDSVAVLEFSQDGRLTPVEHVSTQGRTPRNFALDPTGRFLWAANQQSDSIVLFKVDPATGRLTPAGRPLAVGSPVCVKFLRVE